MNRFVSVSSILILLIVSACGQENSAQNKLEVASAFSTSGEDDDCGESTDNKSASRPPNKDEVRTSVFGWNGDDYRGDPWSAIGCGQACFDLRAVPAPYKAFALSPALLKKYGLPSRANGTYICVKLDNGTVLKGPVLSVTHESLSNRVDIYTYPEKDLSLDFKRVIKIKKIAGQYKTKVPQFDCENPKDSTRPRATGRH